MQKRPKVAAISAAKWALLIGGGLAAFPLLFSFLNGTGLSSQEYRLVFGGVIWFPIIFLVLWLWGTLSGKDPLTGSPFNPQNLNTYVREAEQTLSDAQSTSETPNKWNYVGLVAGIVLFVLFIFELVTNPNIEDADYFGAVIWVALILFCGFNIFKNRAR